MNKQKTLPEIETDTPPPEAKLPAVVGEVEPPAEPPKCSSLVDLRQNAMALPAENMKFALAEYEDRRKTFREWLRGQLVEGIHYGYPPGTEPKYDGQGRLLMYSKGGWKVANEKQWKPKPSLYKAGADFMVDLMGLRPEYAADIDAWTQGGSVNGTFVFRCNLVSKSTGEVVGEGYGANKVGKNRDENAAIKMAKKSAKVAAVLDAYGLADLFTQDTEDGAGQPPKHPNPEADPKAPATQTRTQRVSKEELANLMGAYTAAFPEVASLTTPAKRKKSFAGWIEVSVLGGAPLKFNPGQVSEWDRDTLKKCWEVLNV